MRRVLLKRSIYWWAVGYLAVTTVNGVLTLSYGAMLAQSRGDAGYDLAYENTVPVHIVGGAVLWTLAARALWRRSRDEERTTGMSLLVAAGWLAASALVDGVVFVGLLANTPAGAPADVFYVDNQPWTSLYYVAVVIGPPAALAWIRSSLRMTRALGEGPEVHNDRSGQG